jgi:hypothetical protein
MKRQLNDGFEKHPLWEDFAHTQLFAILMRVLSPKWATSNSP